MAEPLLKSTLLRVCEGATLSVNDDGRDVLRLVDGSDIYIDHEERRVVELYATAHSLESGVLTLASELQTRGPADALERIIQSLERGLIERAPAVSPNNKKTPSVGMFGCPHRTLEDALGSEQCDVVFIGMPYGLGVTGRRGAETGPSYLRACSRTAFDYTEIEGQAVGWWHPHLKKRVLENVRFCDIGDIFISDLKRNGPAFDDLYRTARDLLRAGRLPVVIGGDHSISLPLITAAANVHHGLGVIHFDAHSDLGSREYMGNWRRNCSHGNFMSWVASNERISTIHQFGIRHLLPEPPFAHPNVSVHAGHSFVPEIEALIASLPKARPYYFTFDVDCFDPGVISQTGTPIPGGLSYREIVYSLSIIASSLNIVAIDIVELIAAKDREDYNEGITISYVLFELLAHVFIRRALMADLEVESHI